MTKAYAFRACIPLRTPSGSSQTSPSSSGLPKGPTLAGALASFEDQVATRGMIVGTPEECVDGIRYIVEYLRPTTIIFCIGECAMYHESHMRRLKLTGENVLLAMREIARELGLAGPYEVEPRRQRTGDHIGLLTHNRHVT